MSGGIERCRNVSYNQQNIAFQCVDSKQNHAGILASAVSLWRISKLCVTIWRQVIYYGNSHVILNLTSAPRRACIVFITQRHCIFVCDQKHAIICPNTKVLPLWIGKSNSASRLHVEVAISFGFATQWTFVSEMSPPGRDNISQPKSNHACGVTSTSLTWCSGSKYCKQPAYLQSINLSIDRLWKEILSKRKWQKLSLQQAAHQQVA